MNLPEYNYLGLEFFGKRVAIEKTNNPQVDEDLKVLFIDSYICKKPINTLRPDVQRVLDWQRKQNK